MKIAKLTIGKSMALLIACMLISRSVTKAQNEYKLIGSARSDASANCIRLTNSGNSQTGAVWFDKRLRLTESFTLTFTINLGSNLTGGDGLAMVFQTTGSQALGGQAGGIGYKGLQPSLGIEFDTYRNLELGDPSEDHIALVSNGIIDHRLNKDFPAPVPILTSQTNAKDGRDHNIKVSWNTMSQTLRVEVDCVLRINQTIDLIKTVFLGTSNVIWGFTAATGTRANVHTVCISKEEIQPDTIQACRNDLITLTAPLSSNNEYQWIPSAGLNDSRIRTPHLKVGNSQFYTIQYFDQCAQLKRDSVFVKAKGVNFSIGEDRQVCENDTVILTPTPIPTGIPITYRWSTGQTTPQLKPTTSGLYSLTVAGDGCSVSDSAKVTFNSLPRFGLLTTEPIYDCPGNQSIRLDPQATGVGLQYFWFTEGVKTPTLTANAPGTYTVQVTTDKECSVIQRFVILDNCPSVQVFVPDAFTPNGDGINDLLRWQGDSNLEVKMKVFDRWGEVLFVSTKSFPYWDGTYQGKLCPAAAYTWRLEYQPQLLTNHQEFIRQGKVLLLK